MDSVIGASSTYPPPTASPTPIWRTPTTGRPIPVCSLPGRVRGTSASDRHGRPSGGRRLHGSRPQRLLPAGARPGGGAAGVHQHGGEAGHRGQGRPTDAGIHTRADAARCRGLSGLARELAACCRRTRRHHRVLHGRQTLALRRRHTPEPGSTGATSRARHPTALTCSPTGSVPSCTSRTRTRTLRCPRTRSADWKRRSPARVSGTGARCTRARITVTPSPTRRPTTRGRPSATGRSCWPCSAASSE